MQAGDFFRKLFSARLWANLGAMLLVVVLLCVGVKVGIDLYTHHGEEIEIPNLRHKSFSDAEHLLEQRGLRIVVSDTGYVRTLPPDCILEQTPMAGHMVKEGRVVYVVINSSNSPVISIPDIIDNCSYREARAKLIAMGFKVGPTEFVPGEKDWVYGLKSNGRMLQNGQKVSVNDVIILQVGDGMRDPDDSVAFEDPDMFPYGEADSLAGFDMPQGAHNPNGNAESDVDEFEVVTGPE